MSRGGRKSIDWKGSAIVLFALIGVIFSVAAALKLLSYAFLYLATGGAS